MRCVQLRTGLHGYETAVRFLKEQPWPEGLLPRTTLELFYAHALAEYAHAYSWEIAQRERVESPQGRRTRRPEGAGRASRSWPRRGARISRSGPGAQALSALPVDRLAEYLQPNNYPKEVRGTLRDAVSYLFVELLADTSFWTPEQSNGVYRLAVARSSRPTGGTPTSRLTDPAAHPAEQIAAILGDLETWHAARRRARRPSSRRASRGCAGSTRSSRTRPTAARSAQDLEARLPRYRSVAWWAMGMAELAEFREAEDAPDNLIRARETAQRGLARVPAVAGRPPLRGPRRGHRAAGLPARGDVLGRARTAARSS